MLAAVDAELLRDLNLAENLLDEILGDFNRHSERLVNLEQQKASFPLGS